MHLSYNQKILLGNGGLWAAFDALTTGFLIAYAIHLGASNLIIGVLGAIPYIGVMCSQLPGAFLINHVRRRTICAWSGMCSRVLWLGIIGAPVLFLEYPLLGLMGVYFVVRFFESLADPAWTSLAADLVPEQSRGAFFSRRLFWISLIGMVAFVAGGLVLDYFPKGSSTGFSTIFGVGIAFGLLSANLMNRISGRVDYAHKVHSSKDIFNSWNGDFGKFLWFTCVFHLGYMIASPFFTAYMLKDLGLSYTFFVLVMGINLIAKLVSELIFGKISDKDGDKPVAMLCVFCTALVPFVFLFITPNTVWLLVPVMILSGLVWGGVELSMFNLLLDLTKRDDRPFQIASYQMISSVPMILGPIIGGIIADQAMPYSWSGLLVVFALSAVLRALSIVFLIPIPERRSQTKVPAWVIAREFMTVMTSRGVHGMVFAVKRFRKL